MELEKQTDCVQDLEEISAQEESFTAGLEELRSLDPLLGEFMAAETVSELREKVEAMQNRKAEVKQQLDGCRDVLQRCVLNLIWNRQIYS